MPASAGDSTCSALRPMRPSPSARRVPRWRPDCPIWDRTWVMRSFDTLRVVLLAAQRAALRLLGCCRLGGWLRGIRGGLLGLGCRLLGLGCRLLGLGCRLLNRSLLGRRLAGGCLLG